MDWPFRVAKIVEYSRLLTGDVLIVKLTDVAPAGIVTVAGTPLYVLLSEMLTRTPFGPAGAEIVTVPVEFAPPLTFVGLRVRLVTIIGLMVSVASLVTVPAIARMVRVTCAAPVLPIQTVKLTELAPPGTVTVAGTATPAPPRTDMLTA